MPPAIAIAGIAAAGSIGGAVLGASASNKAAKTAASAQTQASAANTALAREQYANNASRLDPTITGGLRSGNALSSLLLGDQPGQGTQQDGPAIPAIDVGTGSIVLPAYNAAKAAYEGANPGQQYPLSYDQWATRRSGGATGGTIPAFNAGAGATNALSGFDQFRNSTNYQWRLAQGEKGVGLGMSALGAFDSGATRKATLEYGQNFASNELGTYMDRLAQQQGFGLTAASALAGVGQNMVSNVTANNNAAASATGNAALVTGQNNANMYGQIGSALGGLASSFGKIPHG